MLVGNGAALGCCRSDYLSLPFLPYYRVPHPTSHCATQYMSPTRGFQVLAAAARAGDRRSASQLASGEGPATLGSSPRML